MGGNRAAVLIGPGTIVLEDREVPRPLVGEVLLEVLAVGVCGSDVHYFQHGRIGDFVVEQPLVLGHEASGRVIGFGDGVDPALDGCRVAIEPGIPCGRCPQCRAGRYNLCPDVRFLATPPIDGAFTQYLVMPADFVHPIPDSFSDAAGALIEPLSVGVWANQKAGTGPQSRVLITGAGPVGLLAASVARARGAARIVVTDISAERLEAATRLGFDARPADAAELAELEPTVLIECSGSPRATADGIRALSPAGRVVLVGMSPDAEVSLPVAMLQNREISLTGTFRYADVYPTAIALVATGRVDLEPFASADFGLADAAAALRAPGADPSIIKAIVRPGR